MTAPKIKEVHVRECRIRLDRKTLEGIVLEHALMKAGFWHDATTAKITFPDATEGSPAYKVGTECVIDLTEDQMLLPQACGDGGA